MTDAARNYLRRKIADIDYCIRIRTEDIARLTEERARLVAELNEIEGECGFDGNNEK